MFCKSNSIPARRRGPLWILLKGYRKFHEVEGGNKATLLHTCCTLDWLYKKCYMVLSLKNNPFQDNFENVEALSGAHVYFNDINIISKTSTNKSWSYTRGKVGSFNMICTGFYWKRQLVFVFLLTKYLILKTLWFSWFEPFLCFLDFWYKLFEKKFKSQIAGQKEHKNKTKQKVQGSTWRFQ